VEFRILGPLEVRNEQGQVVLGGIKLRAVLAVLLLHANESVSAERLALALWGEDARGGATKTVQVHVSRLRKALCDAEVLVTTPAGYRLRVRAGELDAERFARLVADGRRMLAAGQAQHAAGVLREALGLWRGPALAELAFEPFAQIDIARLEEQRLAAVEARVDADLAVGRHTELVSELRQLMAENPTRERLAGQLMLALYRCGRQAEALDAYQRTRVLLADELGLEPGPALTGLQAQVLEQASSLELSVLPTEHEPRVEPGVLRQAGRGSLSIPRPLQLSGSSLFVGRERELECLREHWAGVCGGERSAVVIGGEAGIGKTRLASELAGTVHGRGALVLYGRCDEGLAVPYQPFVEALRPFAREAGLDGLRAELGYLAPELARLLPELTGLGEPVRADPESERFALFEAVAALVETMTLQRPALLVVDDLHWAARPTLLLLRHLIRTERQLNVLLVATYRETELDPSQPLAHLLADLHRDASATRLSIGGLDETAIATLLEATVGHMLDDRASQLVQLLRSQTAGNPLFIRELLAHLLETSAIFPEGERLSTAVTAAQLQAPEGLRQVIAQRVARLSALAQHALTVAAVAGPIFSLGLLKRVLGDGPGVHDALDEAVAAGLLTEAGHGQYGFAHALVLQTIYGQLGAARRMRVHRQLGEALEAPGATDAHVEALAHHFAQAAGDGQGLKAAYYALAAGRSAAVRLGYEEAAAHYERGLDALVLTEQPQHERRSALLLALGEARWGAGELDKARETYAQAAELAENLGDATALAHAALGFCGPHRFEMAAAVTRPVAGLLQQALGSLGDNDSALRARLMGRLASALAYTDVDHRKPMLARQALQIARRVGDKETLADVLASCLSAIGGPDVLHESLAIAVELRRVADELGDSRLRAAAHVSQLDRLLELGDIDAVEHELEALQRLADARQDRYLAWVLAVLRAGHAHLQGHLEHFETLARDALSQGFEGHDEPAARIFGMHMILLRSEQGRLAELLEAAQNLAEQYPRIAAWRCVLALIYTQLGQTARARGELEALARNDFCDVPRDETWLPSVSVLSVVFVAFGDAPRAQLLYELLLPYADRCVNNGALLCTGSVSRALGLLATTLSQYQAAARHFEEALEMNTRIRSPLWIAHTHHGYAHMLLLRDRPGDRDRALELLEQALATAERLDLKALADKVRALKLSAEAAGPSPALSRPA
jgi:DNA-binding SARP family transcriptional activator